MLRHTVHKRAKTRTILYSSTWRLNYTLSDACHIQETLVRSPVTSWIFRFSFGRKWPWRAARRLRFWHNIERISTNGFILLHIQHSPVTIRVRFIRSGLTSRRNLFNLISSCLSDPMSPLTLPWHWYCPIEFSSFAIDRLSSKNRKIKRLNRRILWCL